MQKELNCKISELVDHELPLQDALGLLDSINDFPELEDKLQRYRAISQVIKTNTFLNSDADFDNRVKRELQHDPVYLLPVKLSKSRNYQILSALVASVAIMVIFTLGGMTKPVEDSIQPLQIADKTPLQHDELDPQILQPTNDRLNDYLEAYRGSLYMAGSPAYQSYVRLADYGQE